MTSSYIEVRGLDLYRGEKKILNQFRFELKKGEILGLVGPNGSGKSTLLKYLNRLIQPTSVSGEVLLGGKPLSEYSVFERSRQITYVGATLTSEFPVTAQEFVEMSGGRSIRKAMEQTDSWEFRNNFISELSSGECQRVSLARAIAQGSKVLCLDESLSQLDLHHQKRIGMCLRESVSLGKSVILVAHEINLTMEWSDRLLFIDRGEKIGECTADALGQTDYLEQLYPGVSFSYLKHPVTGKSKII